MHGVFMRAAGAGGRLEEERVENLTLEEVGARAHEGLEHFGGAIKIQDFVAGEVVEECNVAAAHVRGVEDFANVAGFELGVECHDECP